MAFIESKYGWIYSILLSLVILEAFGDDSKPITAADKPTSVDENKSKCPEEFKSIGNGYCVKLIGIPNTQSDASNYCFDKESVKINGGRLLTIDTEDLWNNVTTFLQNNVKQMWSAIWIGYSPVEPKPNTTVYEQILDNNHNPGKINVNESFWATNHIHCNEEDGKSVDPSAPSEDRTADHGLALHMEIKEDKTKTRTIDSVHWFRQDSKRMLPFMCIVHVNDLGEVDQTDVNTDESVDIHGNDTSSTTTTPKANITVTGVTISSTKAGSTTTAPSSQKGSVSTIGPTDSITPAKQSGGGSGSTAAVVIVFLLIAIIGGSGFVLYRKRMWPFGPRRGHSSFPAHSYSTDQL